MNTKLSVNINKIALLRNARGIPIPDPIQFALDCQKFGADGITVHPRPDERHITRQDVRDLAMHFPAEACEYNIEGYPSRDFIDLVLKAKPTQVTLVPDSPDQLTSDHGWDVISNQGMLTEVLEEFKQAGIRTSLFMDPIASQIEKTKLVGADRIEFYTGPYAHGYASARDELQKQALIHDFVQVLPLVQELKLGINAGHDLNLNNLSFFKSNISHLLEVSIGQAFVRDCLYYGLDNTINMYKRILE